MIVKLPLEVHERIIDFCAHDSFVDADIRTLHACALTCRGWVPRSRLHLYRYIRLPTERAFRHFLSTIRATPELGSFMCGLDLGKEDPGSIYDESAQHDDSTSGCQDVIPSNDSEAPQAANSSKESSSWMFVVPLHLLPLLPTVCSLTLTCLPPFNSTTDKVPL